MSRNLLLVLVSILGLVPNIWGQMDTIADQRIQEVVVIAKLPVVEIKPGKLTYRMDATINQSQGTVYDALSTLPGVILRNDGSVYLNGQAGATIMLDGKLTYLSGQDLVSLLKSTPVGVIDKIDLITHPSSRFDASGLSGIIDIRTRKILRRGMNLSLNGSYDQWRYGAGYGSASLNARTEKLNFFLTYSYFEKRYRHQFITTRDIFPSLGIERQEARMEQDSYRFRWNRSHYYRAGLDYQVSANTVVGLSTDGSLGLDKELGDVTSVLTHEAGQPGSPLRTRNDMRRARNNLTVVLNLTHTFNTDGGVLDASVDYLRYRNREKQLLDSQDTLRGNLGGGIRLYSGQANLVWPFSKVFTLRGGAKTSFISIGNEADYDRWVGNHWNPDRVISNDFKYAENINAGYAQLDIQFQSFQIEAGFRLENTRVEGAQSGNTQPCDSSFTNRYNHLFPNVSVQYSLPHGNSLALTYGKRIVRPNYRDLNPFIYIFDEYTYEQGNTKLQPELTDNLELAYIHKDLFRAGLMFSYTKDVIIKSYLDEGTYRVYVTPENLSSRISVGPQVSTSQLPVTSFWGVSASASLLYHRYRLPDNYRTAENKRMTPSFSLSNQFSLGRNWTAELSGFFNGKMAMGQATVDPLWQVNAGIRKTILGGKGTIQLFARDIFYSNISKVHIQSPNQLAFVKEWQDTRVIGISLSYRFNRGMEVKESRRKHSIDESKRINL